MNRNPKHRLGAQRDAAELKEHPFFKTIDWHALSLKQVTPPFKPVVESDESTSNFDPEFTSADLRDAGVASMDLDEEDPSEEWVANTVSSSQHMYNGPLGSDKNVAGAGANGHSLTNGSSHTNGQTTPHDADAPQGIQIRPNMRRKKQDAAGSPLTNSVQENFRGFTYSGESMVPLNAAGPLAQRFEEGRGQGGEGGEEEGERGTSTEDEYEDDEACAGRYSRRNGGDVDMDI